MSGGTTDALTKRALLTQLRFPEQDYEAVRFHLVFVRGAYLNGNLWVRSEPA